MDTRYDSVIFDLDGTLLDSGAGIIAAIRATLEERGIDIPSQAQLETFVGPPLPDSFNRVCGIEGDALVAVVARYRELYRASYMFEAQPYEGIPETLETLHEHGLALGVASNKLVDLVVALMEHYGFDRYMSSLHGSDIGGVVTKADSIRACMADWNAGRAQACHPLMVGDSVHDGRAAAEVGVPFLGVTYGFGFTRATDVDTATTVGSVGSARGIVAYAEGRA